MVRMLHVDKLRPPVGYPDDALRLSGSVDGLEGAGGTLSSTGVSAEVLRRTGHFAQAAERFRRVAIRAERFRQPAVLCWGLWGQASSLRNQARYPESAALYVDALAVARGANVVLCERW